MKAIKPIVKILIIIGFILELTSCLKEKTWRDYGDYYSFDEGFIWDGKEYHERKRVYWFGLGHRWLTVFRSYERYTFHYEQQNYSCSPEGDTFCLDIYSYIDTANFRRYDRLYVDWPNLDVLFWRGNTDYTVLDGWLSFCVEGDQRDKIEYCSCIMPEAHFEFKVQSPDGTISFLKDGYIFGRDYDQ